MDTGRSALGSNSDTGRVITVFSTRRTVIIHTQWFFLLADLPPPSSSLKVTGYITRTRGRGNEVFTRDNQEHGHSDILLALLCAAVVSWASVVRPSVLSSSVRLPSIKPIISETGYGINAIFGAGGGGGELPIYHICGFFLYLKSFKFWFFLYDFIFYFRLTREQMGGGGGNNIFSERAEQLHAPKFMYTLRVIHYQSCFVQIMVKFTFWILAILVIVFVNIGPNGSERHLPWKYTPDSLPQIHVYS